MKPHFDIAPLWTHSSALHLSTQMDFLRKHCTYESRPRQDWLGHDTQDVSLDSLNTDGVRIALRMKIKPFKIRLRTYVFNGGLSPESGG
ncbi:MAG: hypothetical protein KDB22_22420 [Planctomycetales bacterium]|nr:hypothetical protein [Planctomycetales bacterium]